MTHLLMVCHFLCTFAKFNVGGRDSHPYHVGGRDSHPYHVGGRDSHPYQRRSWEASPPIATHYHSHTTMSKNQILTLIDCMQLEDKA
ncbi:MAG: hypothetical protein IJR26_09085 [Bacteroidales bacterium]|nr:hypothetical protein [Bacteroidales bacterium]